jgi:hypothetical protein
MENLKAEIDSLIRKPTTTFYRPKGLPPIAKGTDTPALVGLKETETERAMTESAFVGSEPFGNAVTE